MRVGDWDTCRTCCRVQYLVFLRCMSFSDNQEKYVCALGVLSVPYTMVSAVLVLFSKNRCNSR